MTKRSFGLILGVVGTFALAAAAFVAYSKGWFVPDSENAGEIATLADKKIDQAPPAAAATGWFQWRGPTRDGRAPAGPLRTDWDKTPPKQLWRAECGGGYSSCTVVGGRLYTQDRQGASERVICLNAEDGKPVWEFIYPADYAKVDYNIGPRATPTVIGDRLWATGGAGELLCLQLPRADGEKPQKVWSKNLLTEFGAPLPQWGTACSPLVVDDLVVVLPGGSKGAVAALDKNTGEVKWTAGSNPPGYSSAVSATVAGRPMIFAFLGDALLAVRPDGTVTDSFAWPTNFQGNIATPLVVDDYVFVSSAYQMGCALLRCEAKGDGVKLVPVYARRGRGFKNHHSSSVYRDRYLYGFDESQLKCVAFETGKPKDGWEADGVGKGSLILADKHLIIQTEGGDLCLAEATPDEFRLVAKVPKVLSGKNNWATPTLVDGRLYLRDETQVLCFDVRP
ncbi:outer membrane protein assembly factor BamB family protein [Gemmata sp.]|uniref:outer membrane protein assembly factor BamB family protein n=1 Tax=Gemmata sp. TaxID=1914242 RepID=UPI003F70D3BE